MLTLLGQKYDPPRALTTVAALGPTTKAAPGPSTTPAKPSAIPEVVPVQTPKPKTTSVIPFVPVNPNPDTGSDLESGSSPGTGADLNTGSRLNAGSDHGSGSPSGTGAGSDHTPKIGSESGSSTGQSGGSDPMDDIGQDGDSTPKGSGTTSYQGSKPVAGTHADASQLEHKPSSVDVGGIGLYLPTQGQSSVVLGHHTASVGGPAVTIAHTPVSLGPSHLVIDGTRSHRLLATAQPADPSAVAVGGHSVAIPAFGASSIVIGSQTASVGGSRITVSDVPISLAPSHLMVGSTSYALPITPGLAKPTFVDIAGYSFAIPSPGVDAITIESQVVSAKGPAITISNTPISLDDDALVVGSSTHPLTFPQPTMTDPNTIGGYKIIPPGPGSSLVIGTHTLTPGQGITISATPISLGSSALVVGTSTIPLPTAGLDQINHKQPHYFAIGSQTIAIKPAGIVVGSQTLKPGGPAITVSGTSYSLGTTEFIAGSLTETFPAAAKPSHFRPFVVMSGLSQIGASSIQDVIAVGDETIKVNPSHVVIHGTTITPGASGVTIDGTVVSLGIDVLVVGSKTETFSNLLAAESTASGGLGQVIMSGFGQMGTKTTDSDQGVPSGSAGIGTGKPSATETTFKGSAVRSIALGGVALLASWSFGLAALMLL